MWDEIAAIVKVVMGGGGPLEPSFGAYVDYCIAFFIRYFALTGAAYWVFYVGFKNQWIRHKIQQKYPSRAQLIHDVFWATVNVACQGLSALVVYKLIRDGHTRMYYSLGERGIPYLVLSSVVCLVGYDTWSYFQHRWMHWPRVFKHVHWIHHHSRNPTSLSAFAQHPLETFLGNSFFILVMLFFPIHPTALAAASLYMFALSVYEHMGFELYPSGFTRHPIFRWFNTATHHNMHHQHVGCHYSIWFNWWDTILQTNHPGYHEAFEATRTRVAQGRMPGAEPVSISGLRIERG